MDKDVIVESDLNSIQNAENKRLSNAKRDKTLLQVFVTLSIILAIVVLALKLSPFVYIGSVVLLLIPFVIKWYYKSGLVKFVKSSVILPALKKLRPNLTYNESHYITESQFNSSNLFRRADRYNGEDLISGNNGKTEFSFSEIHAEEEHTTTDSDGNTDTSYSTIFKGIFMIAEFNKIIKNETYVYTSGGKWFSRFKRVKMEDPLFEDRFNVYSNDQIEARYILTPAMMQRVSELEKRFNSKLFMSFIGNNVFIALGNSKNYFEPNVSQEINEETISDVVAEIDSCIAIVDHLDLNTRIWTKD